MPANLEPPDYETPLNRALLINKINDWYYKKFKPGASDYVRVSVFDLIADFIMDTKFGTQNKGTLSSKEIRDIILEELDHEDTYKDLDIVPSQSSRNCFKAIASLASGAIKAKMDGK